VVHRHTTAVALIVRWTLIVRWKMSDNVHFP